MIHCMGGKESDEAGQNKSYRALGMRPMSITGEFNLLVIRCCREFHLFCAFVVNPMAEM